MKHSIEISQTAFETLLDLSKDFSMSAHIKGEKDDFIEVIDLMLRDYKNCKEANCYYQKDEQILGTSQADEYK